MTKKDKKAGPKPEPVAQPEPEPEPEMVRMVEVPVKKSDEPVKRLVCASGKKWYVDADGNKLED
jgi:hypothetical protein